MAFTEHLQKKFNLNGYGFVDTSKFLEKIFFACMLSFAFCCVLCAELRYGEEIIVLPRYVWVMTFLVGVSVPVCNVLLGKAEYEITCLKETLQIHRFCIFLDRYEELGMEGNIRWVIRIADKYQSILQKIQLHLVTGREAEWERAANECNQYMGARTLEVMWIRIFEHIKELDMLENSGSEDLFKSQFEYATKVCYEQLVRLQNRRIFVCKLIAYLPVFCTVIFYMIYPFVLEGIKLLNMYSEEMKALGMN